MEPLPTAPGGGFKVAFIGTHGVGKTTLCYGLAARLKARDVSLDVVNETARRCPLPINRDTSLDAQSWILHTQIAEEIFAQGRHPVVICDRSALDNYVYLLVAAGRQEPLEPLLAYWMSTYRLLIHVPILERPSADGIRELDPAFQEAIDGRLRREIERRGLDCHFLDPEQRGRWLDEVQDLVLDRLQPDQFRLEL